MSANYISGNCFLAASQTTSVYMGVEECWTRLVKKLSCVYSWFYPLQTCYGTVPLASFTLFGSLVLLRTFRALERVPYWPQLGPLGMGVDMGAGPGSPAEIQRLLWWSSDTRDEIAGWCTQVWCLSWGSFVKLSCSLTTRWYTLPVLSLRSLIIPVICLLISTPSSPSQTTLRKKGVGVIGEICLDTS